MAKKDGRKKKDTPEVPAAPETAALNGHALHETAVPPPGPVAPPPGETAPALPPGPSGSAWSAWSADDLAGAALMPLRAARAALPASRTPVVLGVVALGLLGVVDWPAALGLGLGWEALRRWGPED